ncbi:MAG: enoyl-CoA hydratase/isomerase family protein [Halioglobus sp.]|nr:enoyl-CoA hydratase/isomerase family protein [Halioglobus sp.]
MARLCASPWGLEDYGPLGELPCLLIGTDNGETVPGDPARIAARLRELPCPVLALGPGVPAPLLRGVDVVVENRAAARPLLRNITRHPVAAMTLVQLLRHNEDVEPVQGLLAESLAYATLQGGAEFAAVQAQGLNTAAAVVEEGPPVLVSRRGAELRIRFNRPAARNAYNAAMRDALYEALQLLHADPDLALAVVTAEGACFSVGGDLAEFGRVAHAATAHAIRSARNVASLLLTLAPRLEFHLHSACIGSGIELPAFGGRVIGRADTFVQLPEIRYGLLPGAGGTVSIPRRIGRQRTAWLALSGRRINASTALQWGLLDAVV